MNILSLFDGIGCGRVALERAGLKVDNYFASEIDEFAKLITQKNYPNTIQLGDVNNFKDWKLPQIDLVIGGSPCQDLSICKNNRQGLKGERSGLFFRYVDCLLKYKPKYFLLENVASMSRLEKEKITNILGVEPIMINSALVSAQQRKRLYWTNIPVEYLPKDKGLVVGDILEKENIDYIDYSSRTKINKTISINKTKPIRIGCIGNGGQGDRVYGIFGKSVSLNANGGGRGAKTGLYKIGNVVRKLTPRECERLQTLPDDYTLGISDEQRYKCIGNGWTVDIIAHILHFINSTDNI